MTYAAWHDHPPRKKKPVDAPIFTESRALHIADSIAPERLEQIKAQAKAEAAAVMAAWERRTGR